MQGPIKTADGRLVEESCKGGSSVWLMGLMGRVFEAEMTGRVGIENHAIAGSSQNRFHYSISTATSERA